MIFMRRSAVCGWRLDMTEGITEEIVASLREETAVLPGRVHGLILNVANYIEDLQEELNRTHDEIVRLREKYES